MIVKNNVLASEVLWYRTGGQIKHLLTCTTSEDVIEAAIWVKQRRLRHLIVGRGSNIIFPDHPFDGAVIYLDQGDDGSITLVGNNQVKSYAGNSLDSVIQFAFKNQLVGLEWAGGLPGSVGAGIRGNVGAFGGTINQFFASIKVLDFDALDVEVLDSDTEPQLLTIDSQEKMSFSYRDSLIKQQKNLIILSVTLQLRHAPEAELNEALAKYHQAIDYRQTHHPLEFPSCGSVFKNIDQAEQIEQVLQVIPELQEKVSNAWHGKVSVGYLIGWMGLSGHQIGGAQISPKHNNFIVNRGQSSSEDIKKIIALIQRRFADTFGFEPEPEVEIVAGD